MAKTINNKPAYVELVDSNGQKISFPKNLSRIGLDSNGPLTIQYINYGYTISSISEIIAIDNGGPIVVPPDLSGLYDLLVTYFYV